MKKGYVCDNDSAQKNGKKTQPPNYRAIGDSHSLWNCDKPMFIYMTNSESQHSK